MENVTNNNQTMNNGVVENNGVMTPVEETSAPKVERTVVRNIYMISRDSTVCGINYNETEDKPVRFSYTDLQGDEMTIALKALIEEIKKLNTDELKTVCAFYLTQSIANFIGNGGYKYWLVTGTNKNGEKVPDEILSLLREYHQLWKEKEDYIVLRNSSLFVIDEKTKKDPNKYAKCSMERLRHDAYIRDCWTHVNQINVANRQRQIAGIIV